MPNIYELCAEVRLVHKRHQINLWLGQSAGELHQALANMPANAAMIDMEDGPDGVIQLIFESKATLMEEEGE